MYEVFRKGNLNDKTNICANKTLAVKANNRIVILMSNTIWKLLLLLKIKTYLLHFRIQITFTRGTHLQRKLNNRESRSLKFLDWNIHPGYFHLWIQNTSIPTIFLFQSVLPIPSVANWPVQSPSCPNFRLPQLAIHQSINPTSQGIKIFWN